MRRRSPNSSATLSEGRVAADGTSAGTPLQASPSQVVSQGLADMPVEPELRFPTRWARPRIPGRAAWVRAAYSGRPLWCCFFDRQMRRGAAVVAGVGGCCLHESAPPRRVWPGVQGPSFQRAGFKRLPGTNGGRRRAGGPASNPWSPAVSPAALGGGRLAFIAEAQSAEATPEPRR